MIYYFLLGALGLIILLLWGIYVRLAKLIRLNILAVGKAGVPLQSLIRANRCFGNIFE